MTRSSFFARVYEVVRMVPRGQVATYAQIAAIVSHRQAARTVGWALHALPPGIDIPWHRVVNSQGGISTGHWSLGEAYQQTLLEAEGVSFNAQGHTDLRRFGWTGLDWPEVEALRARWTMSLVGNDERPWRESNPRHMV